MEGLWLWSGLILLFIILVLGCKNEWMGIRYLFNRDPEKAKQFVWEDHRGVGRVAMALALIWSSIFVLQAPNMTSQYSPGFTILLVLAVLCLAMMTWVSGWLTRLKRRRWKLMIHQAFGYFFVMLIAFFFVLITDEHVFK